MAKLAHVPKIRPVKTPQNQIPFETTCSTNLTYIYLGMSCLHKMYVVNLSLLQQIYVVPKQQCILIPMTVILEFESIRIRK